MKKDSIELEKIQKLVLDIIKVERNHYIPETQRRENVVEHSFSLAILCWRVFDIVKPSLDITKILKYALVHDFSERGQKSDVNTYAKEEERRKKRILEAEELSKLSSEFKEFSDFTSILNNYEKNKDEEALFVWSVDKMQARILGWIDNWRPYKEYEGHGIPYKQFSDKGEEFITKCSPYLKDLVSEICEESNRTYYDRPGK